MSWPSDDAYLDSQPSAHPIMADPFIVDAFSRPVPNISHDFSRVNMDPTFPASTWSASDYQVPTDNTPPWIFGWQQPQQISHTANAGSDRDMSVFPSPYSPPPLGHSMLATNTFGSASTATGLGRTSAAQLTSLEHSPLHNAVAFSDLGSARSLLAAGANPNSAARGGMTPLHYAAYQRNAEAIRLLLDYGANLDAVTDMGRSVLFFAIRNQGHLGSSSDLAAFSGHHHRSETPSHTDEDTMRAIDALYNEPTRWIRLLRSLDKADNNGVTPLMMAAGEGFHQTATLLLERGARPEARDHANHTALRYAARNGHRDLVRLLLLADPAVSSERDLSHILKLASKNFTARRHSQGGHEGQAPGPSWDSWPASALIAEEMASLCQEMGVLDALLRQARERCKTHVLQLLLGATRQLGAEHRGSGEGAS
jgi:ankyrin repeat protein